MDIRQFQDAVIARFKGGEATDEEYAEMAAAVLNVSEASGTPAIEKAIGLDDEEHRAARDAGEDR